ncbi:MAG: DUF7146 domain-containing protein [Tsuneonella suprasediminis]
MHAAAASIVKSLGGTWKSSGAMCRCPAHDDQHPSLSVRVGEHSILFKCFAGCSTIDVIRSLRTDRRPIPKADAETDLVHADGREWQLAGRIRALWKEARPITDMPASAYMALRGFSGPHPALRYHDHVPLGRGVDVRFRPALLAAVEADAGVIALERLFLDSRTGLPAKDLDPPKLMLGRPRGGTVRFGAATDVLGLAEGWETAWSAHLLLGIPVWAALGADRFPLVTVPERVERLFVLHDNDRTGRRGAGRARQAHARDGRSIDPLPPPHGFNDWNDLYRTEGRGREMVAESSLMVRTFRHA